MKKNPFDPWTDLASEGRFDLIERLRRAEVRESGYGTIIVTKEGFSPNDATHNKVLAWLRYKDIRYINPINEIANLRESLGLPTEYF